MMFLYQLWCLAWILAPVCAADGNRDGSRSSLTTIITNSNLKSDFSVNTDTSTSSSSKKSTTAPTATSLDGSLTTEDAKDKELLKFIFTETAYYYDMMATMDSQSFGLRLDVLQNDVWVMNGNQIMNCSEYVDWEATAADDSFSTFSDMSNSLLPTTVTAASQYNADVCAENGAFVTDDSFLESMPSPGYGSFNNYDQFGIPYLNTINATGTVLTGNFSIISSEDSLLSVADFPFLDVNDTNVYVGAFGLARNTMSETGILEALTNADLIKSNGYSLYFNDFSDTNMSFAQVIPGMVDSKYYVGDLYQFDMLEKEGSKFPKDQELENELLSHMVVPVVGLDDVSVENDANGDTLSLSSKVGSLPAVFDTRTIFNMMPLDIIVNLAIQTNAFYNSEVNRWIVNCDTLRSTQASVKLTFGDFSVNVPITDLIINATSNGSQLTFTDGAPACFLNFLPSSNSYAVIGLSVLKSIYLVVDNEGKTLGMAAANKQLSIHQSDYFSDNRDNSTHSSTTNDTAGVQFNNQNGDAADAKSIAYIQSGKIPFASTVSNTEALTLSYSSNENDPDTLTVPARFSGVVITSGEVFLTQSVGENTYSGSMASAASDDDDGSSTGSSGSMNKPPFQVPSDKKWVLVPYTILLIVPIVMIFM